MENQDKPKEEYVPRYLQQNKEIKRSWYDQFKKWTQEKSRYKTFRTNIIRELYREGSKENKVHLGTLETTVPLFMANTFVLTLILTRKEGRFNMIFKSLGATCFTYLAMVFYGEERYFFQNLMRNDVVGFYLRERYLEDMKGHYYSETFQNINSKFMSQYSVLPQPDIQILLQKIDSNLKK